MEGKRFGIGLAAGLLVGLAIVTAAGGLSSPPSWAGPLLSNSQGAVSTTYSAKMMATTSTTATSRTSTTPSLPANVGSANSTQTTNSQTSISVTTASVPPAPTSNQGSTNSASPAFSSRFSAISQQPTILNALILMPVLAAFLLGAILYRVSSRGEEPAGEGAAQSS